MISVGVKLVKQHVYLECNEHMLYTLMFVLLCLKMSYQCAPATHLIISRFPTFYVVNKIRMSLSLDFYNYIIIGAKILTSNVTSSRSMPDFPTDKTSY